ncbi:adenine nucleotide alpha hydrolases-like protein [Polyporus arcularius HHB13444]|uniref:tRNA(Ile)-lysidine synthetase n=1 Tax=Polyporus arcularius HHB13444 TaxID=1314778 RepID=A0A5C3Q193_9APHY|nr:adenine nucleotide alpha hydrolases-like protein [Polyporus arcularius HHB13444]
MRPVAPITPAEFFHLLQRCIPPVGWPKNIAVANSGGPDSTALLFLLTATARSRISSQERKSPLNTDGFFHEVTSIHVNHDLQEAASSMEEMAENNARICGARSIVEMIPWGRSPFPARPGAEPAGEKVTREARYNRLFGAMQWVRTNVIAFAHHADDQVETVIMRMSQGSSARGLAGMRPVRRWGMGQRDNRLYTFGANGMRSWVVRPFLHVSKDRLLATCEANGLDYVNDPTNFQPALTIRNAIRKTLSDKERPYATDLTSAAPTLDITPYVDRLRAMVPDYPPSEQPREAVRLFGIRLEEVETQVTEILNSSRLPSPPSTLLLASSGLTEATDNTVRTELIRRCLRYVSPGPWGSLWAEGHGDRDTYQRIANLLWPSTPLRERRPFTAGAGVVAHPVAIRKNSRHGTVRFRSSPAEAEAEGWLLARAEPYQRAVSSADQATTVDITDGLVNALEDPRGRGGYSILYDHRFFVDFDLSRMPPDVAEEVFEQGARITIKPDTRWFLPSVILGGDTPREIGRFFWRIDGWQRAKRPPLHQTWIRMKFIRSLDAL